GIGERLSPAPRLPACGLALVNPGQALPTQAVFRARQGPFSGTTCMPAGWPDAAAMARTLALLGNDLEAAAITICPEIADVLGALRATAGCLLARMSGSGATCFGLFAEPDAAIAAAGLLARERWWSWGGAMRTA
ncbi:MAG: 4-(cytidine 5'-diphospho)-2-C-methyl-D-erythritol kinase, partial [Acetobacteraceae bacterium]|nr:4-(cytidine 5'-diphospho)-2-C-methyl-D-erythritol kinase [Acetobacteraceae bacterium]